MHAPPSYQITLRHFGLWHIGCSALAAASLGVLCAWAVVAASAHPAWLLFSAAVWGAASFGLIRHAARLAATSLRWDGQVWHAGPSATMGEEPHAGSLSVAMDLGSWMLLYIAAQGVRPVWLPAQRRGHELAWHGFRATVYCARPVSQPTAAPL